MESSDFRVFLDKTYNVCNIEDKASTSLNMYGPHALLQPVAVVPAFFSSPTLQRRGMKLVKVGTATSGYAACAPLAERKLDSLTP